MAVWPPAVMPHNPPPMKRRNQTGLLPTRNSTLAWSIASAATSIPAAAITLDLLSRDSLKACTIAAELLRSRAVRPGIGGHKCG